MTTTIRRMDAPDVIDSLLMLGMNRETATMTIPYVWFAPATTDPYSAVIIALVEAIQHTLLERSIPTRADGYVDARTSLALAKYAGPRWKNRPWIHVIDDLLFKTPTKGRAVAAQKEMAMGYYGSLGGMSKTDWCSDRNPQGNCAPIAGVCKPMDSGTLGLFKSVQREVNKIHAKQKKALIGVDGRFGPGTVRAVNAIMGTNFGHCDDLAARADTILTGLASLAAGLPQPPDPRPTAPPSVAGPGGTVTHPPDDVITAGLPIGDRAMQFVKTPAGMASVAGLVVVGLILFGGSKKKRKPVRKKPTRRRRTPRARITRTYY